VSAVGRLTAIVSLAALVCLWVPVAAAESTPADPPGSSQATTSQASPAATGGEQGATGDGATQAPGASPVPIRANLPQLEDEVMCPICGTLLGMSRAPAAERQRAFMRRLIREGKTNEEIKDALVVEYGPQVLGLPDDDEINFFVYLVPLLGLILAALGVLWAAIRWRRARRPDDPTDSPGVSSTDARSRSDAARLDRDLAEHDL
jgi:cytochrome c-type biogenesis protein CcmH